MTGVIETVVEAGRYLFIESNAICSEDHVCRGEDRRRRCLLVRCVCACFSGFPLIMKMSFFAHLNQILASLFGTPSNMACVPPRIQRESPLLKTNLPHCFYLTAFEVFSVACQLSQPPERTSSRRLFVWRASAPALLLSESARPIYRTRVNSVPEKIFTTPFCAR